MKIFIKRNGGRLEPANAISESLIEGLKNNTWYSAKITKPRNINFHRKFFALLNEVVERSDFYTGKAQGLAVEELKERIKFKIGHYKIFGKVEGVVIIKTKSISFGEMDNIQFEEFYKMAINAILEDEELGISELNSYE